MIALRQFAKIDKLSFLKLYKTALAIKDAGYKINEGSLPSYEPIIQSTLISISKTSLTEIVIKDIKDIDLTKFVKAAPIIEGTK